MFDAIAPNYDLLNHLLSFGIDHYWRWRAVRSLRSANPETILDVASGTGDLALALLKLKGATVTATDISPVMIRHANAKFARRHAGSLTAQLADAEQLPFNDASFDVVTVGFGVRNFGNLDSGLQEMARVTKPGGAVMILEFSRPQNSLVRWGYDLYSRTVIPWVGKLISGDAAAYRYLPASVRAFPEGQDFLQHLSAAGYANVSFKRLSFGIVSIYRGAKPPLG